MKVQVHLPSAGRRVEMRHGTGVASSVCSELVIGMAKHGQKEVKYLWQSFALVILSTWTYMYYNTATYGAWSRHGARNNIAPRVHVAAADETPWPSAPLFDSGM